MDKSKKPSPWKRSQGVDQERAKKLQAGFLGQNVYNKMLKERQKKDD